LGSTGGMTSSGTLTCCALKENDTLITVQTTSGSNVSARLTKIAACPGALLWLQSPTRRIEVHGWRKVGERGKRKTWQCRRVEVTLEDLKAPISSLPESDDAG
jgi:hypothetical protein